MSRRTKQLVTAAAVTTVIAVAAALVVLVPRYLHRQITVHAHFKDAVGLYSGNAVSVLGMQVGSVSSIESRGDHVEVTMKLDRDIPIPADVTAVTVSASLLTDRHIELTPPYTDGPRLLDGDLVPIGHTRTPVEFDKTLSMMNKLGSALRGDDRGSGPLGDLVNLGSQISSGNGEKIKSTLDKLSDALRVGPDGGDRTSKNIQEIVRGVAAQIRRFGSNVRQISDLLAEQNLGTGSTGAKLNQILSQVNGLLTRHRDELRGTFTSANTITTSLSDNQRGLAEVIDVVPLTVDNVYDMIDPGAGTLRVHLLTDKIVFASQFSKEICNLMGLKQLGCATGTMADYGPDFGLTGVLDLMANGIGPTVPGGR
jgi:virulence factor Mce-like protein